jgi:hypothetical protein
MPRYAKTSPTPSDPQPTLASRIKAGKVVPIISNVVTNDLVLAGQPRLVQEYARRIVYPLSHQDDLSQMLQFKSITDKALGPGGALPELRQKPTV